MAEVRLGRQTPTKSFILPYKITDGSEAIKLYEKTKRTAQDWQKLLTYDILAKNDDDLWVHTKFGYCVPRRNGKNEIVTIREMYGLTHGEHILHTAHRTSTTHMAWERLYDLLEKAKVKIVGSYKAFGKEHIELKNGGIIEFRTRTSKGGLGEGYDLLIIDEAQEYQDDQESALKYVVSSSRNPQTIFCGTPPTAVSTGTIFVKLRRNVLSGVAQDTGWAEWSVESMSDPDDHELWYETNPSLGTILTERKISDEMGSDDVDFNIQRLGLWISYNQKSAISAKEWDALVPETLPKLKGKLFIGIKYGQDGTNAAMSLAVKTTDGKVFIEAVDCRPVRASNRWIMDFLRKASWAQVVIDGANGQKILADLMKSNRMRKPILPTVQDVIKAGSEFEQAIFDSQIVHMDQPSLSEVISNCEHRAIGTNGGFGFKSLTVGREIALMESADLAYWAAIESKDKVKQTIRY